MTRPRCACEANPAIKCRFSSFRNPPLKWRVFLVAAVFAMPGFLAGGMASLFLGEFFISSFAGALTFALVGAVMEAWPLSPPTSRSTSRGLSHSFDRLEVARVLVEKR